jgi:hypothetical protein
MCLHFSFHALLVIYLLEFYLTAFVYCRTHLFSWLWQHCFYPDYFVLVVQFIFAICPPPTQVSHLLYQHCYFLSLWLPVVFLWWRSLFGWPHYFLCSMPFFVCIVGWVIGLKVSGLFLCTPIFQWCLRDVLLFSWYFLPLYVFAV